MNTGVHVSLSILVSSMFMPSSGIAESYGSCSTYTQWNITQLLKKNEFESLEPIIKSEVSQEEKHQYSILTHIYGI